MTQRIELGSKVKDMVTGFQGVVVCRIDWLFGCTRIGVQPPIDKDGKHLGYECFDEQQLELVKAADPKLAAARSSPAVIADPGGPRDNPPREPRKA